MLLVHDIGKISVLCALVSCFMPYFVWSNYVSISMLIMFLIREVLICPNLRVLIQLFSTKFSDQRSNVDKKMINRTCLP